MNGQFKIGELSALRYFIGVAVLAGLLFAFIAPDEEHQTHWLLIAIQWQLQTVVPTLFAIFSHLLLFTRAKGVKLHPWWKLLLSGTIAAVLFAPIALLLDVLIEGNSFPSNFLHSVTAEFLGSAPPVVLCWLGINAPFQFGYQLNKSPQPTLPKPAQKTQFSTASETESTCAPSFMSLIAKELHGQIIYLKSELHYVLVVTDAGQDLILYALKEAILELQALDGVKPHRSYWVNKNFIKSFEKIGRQGQLTLENDVRIPVSRTKLKELSTLEFN